MEKPNKEIIMGFGWFLVSLAFIWWAIYEHEKEYHRKAN